MAMTDDSAASVSTVRDQPEGAPPSQPVVMLAVRFVLELIAFGSIGVAVWTLGDGGIFGGVLAAIAVVTAAAAWGTLAVPDDPTRNPKAAIAVPGWLRLVIELSIFGLAAWSLWVYVSRAASETFLTAIGIMMLVGWDRIWWMLRRR